jgi:Protein of unknown function (DUF2975)
MHYQIGRFPVVTNPVPHLNSRLCRRLALVAAASAFAFLIINAVLWLVPAWTPLVARGMANLQTEPITLTPPLRAIGLLCSTLYLGVLAWGLWVASALFRRLAAGLVFEPLSGVLLRRFGMALLLYAALTPFVATLMAWLVTMYNPPHFRLLRIGISDHEVVLAIVGTLIIATGSVMAEAARLAEENRQII